MGKSSLYLTFFFVVRVCRHRFATTNAVGKFVKEPKQEIQWYTYRCGRISKGKWEVRHTKNHVLRSCKVLSFIIFLIASINLNCACNVISLVALQTVNTKLIYSLVEMILKKPYDARTMFNSSLAWSWVPRWKWKLPVPRVALFGTPIPINPLLQLVCQAQTFLIAHEHFGPGLGKFPTGSLATKGYWASTIDHLLIQK